MLTNVNNSFCFISDENSHQLTTPFINIYIYIFLTYLCICDAASPKAEQSLAYLLRNEILTNIENLQAELEYLIKNLDEETDDLRLYADSANKAMVRYLEVVPPNELRQAKSVLLNSQSQ
jgi:hypothetical protein